MGGTCGVVIRKADGTVLPMARHTGVLSSLVMSLPFLRGDEETAIAEFCESFNGMRADFLENQYSKKFKFPMTPIYGWCDEQIPVEYGLVVFDFKARKIHSMQSYGDVYSEFISRLGFSGGDELKKILMTAMDEKLLSVYDDEKKKSYSMGEYFGPHAITSVAVKSFIEKAQSPARGVLKLLAGGLVGKGKYPCDSLKGFSFSFCSFIPANSFSFSTFNHKESLEGITAYFNTLKADGFVFTKSEATQWADFAEHYLYDVEYEEGEKELTREDLTAMFTSNMPPAPGLK